MSTAEIVTQDRLGRPVFDPASEILPEREPAEYEVSKALERARSVAVWVIALGTLATAAATFAQSYRGLYEWSSHHLVTGNWAYFWPVQVDTFIAIPELVIFTGIVDRWPAKARIPAWLATIAGTAASIAANVGHAHTADWLTRATFAVPPLAASCCLAFGLATLKRIVSKGKSR